MIRFGEDEAHIRTIVEKNDKEYRIDMHLRKNGAKVFRRHMRKHLRREAFFLSEAQSHRLQSPDHPE